MITHASQVCETCRKVRPASMFYPETNKCKVCLCESAVDELAGCCDENERLRDAFDVVVDCLHDIREGRALPKRVYAQIGRWYRPNMEERGFNAHGQGQTAQNG